MKLLRSLPLTILPLVLLLSACASSPPEPAQPFYTGPLRASLLSGIERIRVVPQVPHPMHTRHASIASRLPYYGLLMPDRRPPGQPTQSGELAIDRLFDINAAAVGEFQRRIRDKPVLAGRLGDDGKASIRLDIAHISIFGKDVSHVNCQPLVLMRARLLAADGRLLWSSGYVGNRIDEFINYPCRDIQEQPAVAVRAITDALNTAIAEIAARI